MKKYAVVMAGLAATVTASLIGSAFAQDAMAPKRRVVVGSSYDKKGSAKYRPLTVGRRPVAPTAGQAVGDALAGPFNAVGTVGGPIGVAGQVAGGAVSGAAGLAFSPINALTGGTVGISSVAAPPLPIKARFAHSGKMTTSYDEGYAQDVPVDVTGPIYKIDDTAMRTVTPFTLAAFPIEGAVSAITSPLRSAAQP